MKSIDIENITKKYKIRGKEETWRHRLKQTFKPHNTEYLTALNKINFSVNKGEIVGILGPNGAGKTTLIKILAGLLLPEDGRATINSYDLIQDREKVRMSVNILMSGGWIIFDYKLSLYQNLRFWGVMEGVPLREVNERVNTVLATVGLYDRKNDFPENLSAGLRQKLNLARCLLSDRPIYLLDEPTANVDPYSAEFLRTHIKNLTKEGKTVVLATHNLWEAEALCDRIAILHRGELLSFDTTETIKKRVGKEAVVLELAHISPGLTTALTSLNYVTHVSAKESTMEVYGEVRRHLPELLDICRQFTTITNVDIKEPSLHEVFLHLIREQEKGRAGS
jgi:ABC-2 type transport system ATP-binding protein